tara:strand:- start:40 stop:231 length:192 start_codon:yes stop_codon:yes gene_type:complete
LSIKNTYTIILGGINMQLETTFDEWLDATSNSEIERSMSIQDAIEMIVRREDDHTEFLNEFTQ